MMNLQSIDYQLFANSSFIYAYLCHLYDENLCPIAKQRLNNILYCLNAVLLSNMRSIPIEKHLLLISLVRADARS
jgi:hypothetical protein